MQCLWPKNAQLVVGDEKSLHFLLLFFLRRYFSFPPGPETWEWEEGDRLGLRVPPPHPRTWGKETVESAHGGGGRGGSQDRDNQGDTSCLDTSHSSPDSPGRTPHPDMHAHTSRILDFRHVLHSQECDHLVCSFNPARFAVFTCNMTLLLLCDIQNRSGCNTAT